MHQEADDAEGEAPRLVVSGVLPFALLGEGWGIPALLLALLALGYAIWAHRRLHRLRRATLSTLERVRRREELLREGTLRWSESTPEAVHLSPTLDRRAGTGEHGGRRALEDFLATYAEADRDTFLQALDAALDTKVPFTRRLTTLSGAAEDWHFEGLTGRRGREVLAHRTDATSLRERDEDAEGRARDTDAMLDALGAMAPLVALEEDGRVRTANAAFVDLLGADRQEVLGAPLKGALEAPEWEVFQRGLARTISEGIPWSGDCRMRGAEGAGWRGLLLPLAHGGAAAHLVLFPERSEGFAGPDREDFERRLVKLQHRDALGRLAGGVAHEFNNLLCGIGVAAEGVSQRAKSGSPQQEAAESIIDACARGAELTRNLLGFDRHGSLEVRDVDLNDLLEQVVGLLQGSFDRRIHLETAFEAQHAVVRGDQGRLQTAILNLALNARDAMPQGGHLRFRTENRVLANGQPGICIEVTDDGEGMDAEVLANATSPHFSTRPESSGLGLASVEACLGSHGGDLTLESKPGVGTRATICLPLSATGAPTEDPPVPPRRRGDGLCILLVEDEDLIRDAVTSALTRRGHEVHAQADGASAAAWFADHGDEVDAVLLDLVMPGMSGAEVLARIRTTHPDTVVVLTSGYTAGSEATELIAAGATAFLGKPYRVERLDRLLRAEVQQAREEEGEAS